jgi:hypothetical protein
MPGALYLILSVEGCGRIIGRLLEKINPAIRPPGTGPKWHNYITMQRNPHEMQYDKGMKSARRQGQWGLIIDICRRGLKEFHALPGIFQSALDSICRARHENQGVSCLAADPFLYLVTQENLLDIKGCIYYRPFSSENAFLSLRTH